MDLKYPLHLLQMKLMDLEYESEKAEYQFGEGIDYDKNFATYSTNLPLIQSLKDAIKILKQVNDGLSV